MWKDGKPVQQKRRPIPLKYIKSFDSLLDDLKAQGVESGPLDNRSANGWIYNPVIAGKNYGNKIRQILDIRPMVKAIKRAKFPIPTVMELRNGKMVPKWFLRWSQNGPYIDPKLSLNGPLIVPKWSLNVP